MHNLNLILGKPPLHESPVVPIQYEAHERTNLICRSAADLRTTSNVTVRWYAALARSVRESTSWSGHGQSPLSFVRLKFWRQLFQEEVHMLGTLTLRAQEKWLTFERAVGAVLP